MPETIFKENLTNNLVRKVWNFIVKEMADTLSVCMKKLGKIINVEILYIRNCHIPYYAVTLFALLWTHLNKKHHLAHCNEPSVTNKGFSESILSLKNYFHLPVSFRASWFILIFTISPHQLSTPSPKVETLIKIIYLNRGSYWWGGQLAAKSTRNNALGLNNCMCFL